LKYASIKAPVDGVVISRSVDVGQTVAASLSAPILFLIAQDLRDMQLEADIDEADIGMIRVGQQVTFTVSTYPDDVFTGTVSQVRIEPIEVQDVVNYKIIVTVMNPEEKLMPGMTATLTVNIETRDDVLRVPNMALRFKPPEEVLKAAMGGEPRQQTGGRERAAAGQELAQGGRRGQAAETRAGQRADWRFGAQEPPRLDQVRGRARRLRFRREDCVEGRRRREAPSRAGADRSHRRLVHRGLTGSAPGR
jgi:HlyD family secretion protein